MEKLAGPKQNRQFHGATKMDLQVHFQAFNAEQRAETLARVRAELTD